MTLHFKALRKDLAQQATESSVGEVRKEVVGDSSSTGNSFVDSMAEGVVLAAAWFTVRMICQVSYKAIKSYRETKEEKAKMLATETIAPAYGGDGDGGAVSGDPEASDKKSIPWEPAKDISTDEAKGKTAEPSSQPPDSVRDDDRGWIEELRRAANSRTRDNLRILGELQGISDKVENMPLEALYDTLRHAMKLLLEYQQNPCFRDAHTTLLQAEEAAKKVYTNERSLVMSLSALRLRIVITYLHCPKHSKGIEPSMDDKDEDKRQCELYISNALKEGPLESLCRRFLASRDSRDEELLERVEREAMLAFDIILEVISSVYLLEPFRPSEGPLPKGAPDVVIYALSTYCKNKLGNSPLYVDLARALQYWESTPERREKLALHCLYRSTEGPGWVCSEGWDGVFEANLSSLYGVSTEAGRVSKISLAANNLEGRLPRELEHLTHLQELSLHNNKLFGKIPKTLWTLPCLRLVALQGNSFTVAPPTTFIPAARTGASAGGACTQEASRRQHGIAGTVEACNPARLDVYKGEWFMCSWKITNTGRIAFASGTKLSRGEEHSVLGGVVDVMVNPLEPGEDHTVSVMMQAPNYEAWSLKDEWALVGEGLDFVDDEDAKAPTPIVSVAHRPAGGRKSDEDAAKMPTLANTVFVANKHRRGSSHYSSSSGSSHQCFR
eukprot:g4919.t1